MPKISNTNFFSQPTPAGQTRAAVKDSPTTAKVSPTNAEVSPTTTKVSPTETAATPVAPVLKVRKQKAMAIKAVADTLQSLGFRQLSQSVGQIYKEAASQRFAVAVVGEFSRGKSTFVNQLLGRDLLPVANLPTTAMLTRVVYGQQERLVVFDKKGNKLSEGAVSQEAWDGLTADNLDGQDPEGFVVVRTPDAWLGKLALEIIDTPGAGDLEEKRARQIGDALLRADGVLITVSATAAMSMSEELFIRQRILTHPNPFMALIVTKLDTIPVGERAAVIGYIKKKLEQWQLNIPVIVPADVEVPSAELAAIVGMDKLKQLLTGWVLHPRRVMLTEQWMTARTRSVIDMARKALDEKAELLGADDEKRAQLLAKKRNQLAERRLEWNRLTLELQQRSNDCYASFVEKEAECTQAIVERLQYECAHTSSPQKWWKEDFPYRMKVELTNLAVTLENLASQIIAADVRWFNEQLERRFKIQIDYDREAIVQKGDFVQVQSGRKVEVEDLNKKRMVARAGTAALSIAGVLAFAGAGFMPLIATMGIGTGSSIVTEMVFKGKLEQQQRELKQAIAKCVPMAIEQAASDSESRLSHVYDEVTRRAEQSYTLWNETQLKAIAGGLKPRNEEAHKKLDDVRQALERAEQQLSTI